jgi:hypothetical protein
MAPTSAAKMSIGSTTAGFTIPFPMVFATRVSRLKAAMKLKKAAQITAILGVNTLVPTTVAIEFAASWKPLMKSKARAKNIIKRMNVTFSDRIEHQILFIYVNGQIHCLSLFSI